MAVADDLAASAIELLRSNPPPDLRALREIRRAVSARASGMPVRDVLDAALLLHEHGESILAFELVGHHRGAVSGLTLADVERFGSRMTEWGSVDAFGALIAGPAWLAGAIDDNAVLAWAAAGDPRWRRAALVATTVLNTKTRGGTGDTERTLRVCGMLVADRDDLVVKAESWALRALVPWDADAVRQFVADHDDALAARVRREVGSKLRTGRKAG